MSKISLKDKYIGGKTPTALKNEVSTCRKMYYNKETWVMVNQSVNEFYTPFLFMIYAPPTKISVPDIYRSNLFERIDYLHEKIIYMIRGPGSPKAAN